MSYKKDATLTQGTFDIVFFCFVLMFVID